MGPTQGGGEREFVSLEYGWRHTPYRGTQGVSTRIQGTKRCEGCFVRSCNLFTFLFFIQGWKRWDRFFCVCTFFRFHLDVDLAFWGSPRTTVQTNLRPLIQTHRFFFFKKKLHKLLYRVGDVCIKVCGEPLQARSKISSNP